MAEMVSSKETNSVRDVKENSNMGLLKIIAIFLIMISLYTIYRGSIGYNLPSEITELLVGISGLGNVGVIILVLISGYNGVGDKTPFRFKNLFLVILQTVFYSVLIYLLFCILGAAQFSMLDFVGNFFPLTYDMYWLVAVFLILYIFTPYINKLLNLLSRRSHLRLILVMMILFSLLPALIPHFSYGSEIVLFVMFYVIGAYFRKYRDNFFAKKRNNMLVLFITVFIITLLMLVMGLFGSEWIVLEKGQMSLLSMRSIASILIAISLFSVIEQMKPITSRVIDSVAGCVLGVYLMVDNYLVRRAFWKEHLGMTEYTQGSFLVLHCISSIVAVFVICVLVELIRKYMIEKVLSRAYDLIAAKVRRRRAQ